ncbi:DUF1345 domain-containing protein [Nonomuraea sp. SMC257]|uniref:DUF1345 domain-containing protein n=1 Tax=Nonomuraea montanisoli TaxID=2741721 RepID=A0A7Y6I3R3_9ACTN|nr:DUF1345 domain-containing protein [Nonomuraea montanisoli]NUW31132.1 DUF1345 domain-containing protein [Nonomuraea montanisoli]
MRPKGTSGPVGISPRRTTLIAAAAGVLALAVAPLMMPPPYVPLIAWDVAATVFLLVTWWRIARLDGAATAADAVREDAPRAGADLLLLTAAVASLAAVGYMIVHRGAGETSAVVLNTGLAVVSVIASWAVVHTVYTLRYARLYYSGRAGGVDFHDAGPGPQPRFSDFAYLAFTVGMTFQVSDTELRSAAFRANVLRQALLSYVFGTVIVALAINFVAGLSR